MKRVLEVGRNCGTIAEASRASVLIDARDYYRAFHEAARHAERSLLLLGWQFDTAVPLLRGEDAVGAGEVRLLPFLKSLCEARPELEIFVLAWDYSLVYALERETMQRAVFESRGHPRIQFRFDSTHPLGASLHEKVVIVDGSLAFLGGIDLCDHRWDDRTHAVPNALRVTIDDEAYDPYHDVQVALEGPVVGDLVELFATRWRLSGGDAEIPLDVRPRAWPPFEGEIAVPTKHVALSRTRGRLLRPPIEPLGEIALLHEDAIAAAERFIYLENQYFTSDRVYRALLERVRAGGSPPLQIVLVLPRRAEAMKEEIALGLAQSKRLRCLRQIGHREGHRVGVYFVALPPDGDHATYIHSKLMIVDDQLLSIGTANLTNRSLGVDSEIDAVFEGEDLEEAIRTVRLELLAEHAAFGVDEMRMRTGDPRFLVDALDAVAQSPRSRLFIHPMRSVLERNGITVPEIEIDPEGTLADAIVEALDTSSKGLFARGLGALRGWLVGSGR